MNHPLRMVSLTSLFVVAASMTAGCGDYSDRVVSTGSPAAPTTPAAGATTAAAATTAGMASMAPPPATSAAATMAPEPSATMAGPSVPPEATCEAVTACGGDVVGTWAAKSSCLPVTNNLDMTGFGLGCSEAPVTGMLAVTGNLTLSADGMVTDETVTTGTETIALPAGCLMISGTVTACDRVGGPMTAIGLMSTCLDDTVTGGCNCDATANQTGGAASLSMRPIKAGTYTVADNVLKIEDNRANVNEYSYCVQGDIMIATLKSLPKAGPVGGQIVFQRQ